MTAFATLPFRELVLATLETLLMVSGATCAAIAVGLPLGIALVLTRPGHLWPKPWVSRAIGVAVNVTRSIPFLILMILLMPVTRLIVGTSLGVVATLVPLSVGAIPFYARLVEVALVEVDFGCIEMGQSLGATNLQIVRRILLPEAKTALVGGGLITCVTLVGYSAMAGVVGGGGLGDLAVRYGYQRFETDTMLLTTGVLVILVQLLQSFGESMRRRAALGQSPSY